MAENWNPRSPRLDLSKMAKSKAKSRSQKLGFLSPPSSQSLDYNIHESTNHPSILPINSDFDPRRTLISPPPEEELEAQRLSRPPSVATKRKRQAPKIPISKYDPLDCDAPKSVDVTPNPKPRKQSRMRQNFSPPVAPASPNGLGHQFSLHDDSQMFTPSHASFNASNTTKAAQRSKPFRVLIDSPHQENPNADWLPPLSSTSVKYPSRAKRHSSVIPIPPYDPPTDHFTPPKEIMRTPVSTSMLSKINGKNPRNKRNLHVKTTTVADHKGEAEFPKDINLQEPMPPASPSEDPILLSVKPKRVRKRSSLSQVTFPSSDALNHKGIEPFSSNEPHSAPFAVESGLSPPPSLRDDSPTSALEEQYHFGLPGMDVCSSDDGEFGEFGGNNVNAQVPDPFMDDWTDHIIKIQTDDTSPEDNIIVSSSDHLPEVDSGMLGTFVTQQISPSFPPIAGDARLESVEQEQSPYANSEEREEDEVRELSMELSDSEIDEDTPPPEFSSLGVLASGDAADSMKEEPISPILCPIQPVMFHRRSQGRGSFGRMGGGGPQRVSLVPEAAPTFTPNLVTSQSSAREARGSRIHIDTSEELDSEDAGGEESDTSVEYGVVKIVSSDPRAAARAAAILKQHDYDCFTKRELRKKKLAKRKSYTYGDLDGFNRTKRLRDVISSGISKSPPLGKANKEDREARRKTFGGVIGDRVYIPGSPLMTLHGLLNEAERSIDYTPLQTPSATDRSSSEETSDKLQHPLVRNVDPTVIEWNKAHWKSLDACFTEERLHIGRTLGLGCQTFSGNNNGLANVDAIDLENVINRFIEKNEDEANPLPWDRTTLLHRAYALRKKQSGSHVAHSDNSTIKLMGNASIDVVESPSRYPSMEVPDWTPIIPRANPQRDPSPQSLDWDAGTAGEADSDEATVINADNIQSVEPQSITKRVKGFLVSYLPTRITKPTLQKPAIVRPGLPLPPAEILGKERGPIQTPARTLPPPPVHPKALVTLQAAPLPAKPSLIPRKAKPRRLVELNHVPLPELDPLAVKVAQPRRSSGSVKDLIKSFEEMDKSTSARPMLRNGGQLQRGKSMSDLRVKPTWRP